MPPSNLWKKIFSLFRNGNGNGHGSRFTKKGDTDPFDALHREFLWLKEGQISELAQNQADDSIWIRNARAFFLQDFVDALTQESIGGNAGAGHTAVHAFYNPLTGEIKHFGNFQEIKGGRWDEITGSTTVEGDFSCLFRINVQFTGEIAEVLFEQKPLSDQAQKRLSTLSGLQVMIPFTRIYQALRTTETHEH